MDISNPSGAIDTSPLNSDSADQSGETDGNTEEASPLDEPIPSTGSTELDGLLDGTVRNPNTNEALPNQNLQNPTSKQEFEDGLRDVAGEENVQTHCGGGVIAELEDGTVIQTYPVRRTDGLPGFTITNPDGQQTHHGSLTG